MNNVQLDMVLNFLNEGSEINSNEFFLESINEFYEQSIYESDQFINLLEEADKDSVLTKVKEAIKKFINWIKTLITKLKLKIKQMSINVLSKILDKNIARQKELAKDADPNAEITLSPMEHMMLMYGNEMIGVDDKKLTEIYEITNKSNKELSEENIDGLIQKTIKKFDKLPLPILFAVAKLSDLTTNAILKANGIEENDKKQRTITVKEYLEKLDQVKDAGQKAKNVLDDAFKNYDEMIKIANTLYDINAKSGNLYLKTATNATKFIIDVTSGALKCITYATSVTNKYIKKAKKKTEE